MSDERAISPGSAAPLRAFLFIDLVGSTQLAADLGAAAFGQVVAEFGAIVDRCTQPHRTGEPPKDKGDGFLIYFPSAASAAQAAHAATGASLAELKGHTNSVRSAAFSPDGTRIVTASQDSTARVWDAVMGASLAELKGHKGPLVSAAFSPDGTRIVTPSDDKTARVWDSIPYRIRHAERRARQRGEDGDAIVQRWLAEVTGKTPALRE